MSYERVGLIANLSLALSLIVALVFGLIEVRVASRERRERLTLEALNTFQSREFAEILQYLDTHELPRRRADLRALPINDQVMFIQYSMLMEDLGIMVAEKMIDMDVVDKTLGSFVSTSWKKLKPLALSMRAEDREPFFAEYFQWLAEEIDARMRANPRKPFYEAAREGAKP